MLGMGIVSAQNPTFSYQTVVVDNNGDLVVDADITANVLVTYTGGSYNETHAVTSSPNGMVILPIGGGTVVSGTFGDIDWKTASISVSYSTQNRTIPNSATSRVEAVPYAIQAGDFVLDKDAIIQYLTDADIDDVYAIMDAVVQNQSGLENGIKDAVLDYIKANRLIAKEIMLYYIENATVADMQALYTALDGNEEAKRVMTNLIVDYIKENRSLVVEVLVSYAQTLTPAELNTLLEAVPTGVKEAVLNYGEQYVMQHRQTVVYPILKSYVATLTIPEFTAAIQALEGNTNGSFTLVLNQFNEWMDEYFTQSGPTRHVVALIDQDIASRHWVDDTCSVDPINLCQLKKDVEDYEEYGANPVQNDCPEFGTSMTITTLNDPNQDNFAMVTVSIPVSNFNVDNATSYGFRIFSDVYPNGRDVVNVPNLDIIVSVSNGVMQATFQLNQQELVCQILPFIFLSSPCDNNNTTQIFGSQTDYSAN